MKSNAKTLSDVIKEANHKIDKPQYIAGNDAWVVYYHKEKNGQIHWAVKEFIKVEEAKEFYLNKLHEFMYELSLPFYKQFKTKGGR